MRTRQIGGAMLRRVAGMAALSAGLVLAVANPAAAHDAGGFLESAGFPVNLAYGGVNQSHKHVWVCDNERDGLGVRLYYKLRSGYVGHIGDSNGADDGCGGGFPGTSSNPVYKFWITAGTTDDPDRETSDIFTA